ncbi:alanine racemase [Syncephalis pseudoplumigaleata]|uniref:Alanine racemase n=1 Tax=Syncephalis pseudoplumigaleata TaxID=1712513 RepID=A0A4P9YYZ5_9FUNG|nr:alanine racemase [Syncephalis pseudoplumigaleata]|eukprot:RKP25165.1 alanine racemase [Syncephalis pseudoplumigaleata]
MAWYQTTVRLQARPRGMHLVTDELVRHMPRLREFKVGMANIFIQHTSASLTINENCDKDVRRDMEMIMNRIAPEDAPYKHTDEGPDDMPAHIKSALLGSSLNIPVRDGELALGTWQGIWLCEHRNHGGARQCVVTIQGELRQ